MNLCFQNTWATKFPWTKSMVGVDGKVHQVKCKVYNRIEGHDKLLVPKLNSLWKHVNPRKAIAPTTNVVGKEHYFLKTNQHVFKEHLYASIGWVSMVNIWLEVLWWIFLKTRSICTYIPIDFSKYEQT
jgi:hypothetical protein